MANEIGDSQISGAVQDFVDRTALAARYAKKSIWQRVLHKDEAVAQHGDRVSVPIVPSVSVNDVGSDGAVTNQQLSLTVVEVVVDKWKEATIEIVDKAGKQSAIDLLKNFATGMGNALSEQMDIDLLTLVASLGTNTVGSDDPAAGSGPMDDSKARQALLKMDNLDIPEESRFWAFKPDAVFDLLSDARFSEAQNTGFSRGLQISGGIPSGLYGFPIEKSSQVQTSANGNYENALLHRECFAVAAQMGVTFEKLARTKLATPMTASALYGVKEVRDDHGVLIYTAPAS